MKPLIVIAAFGVALLAAQQAAQETAVAPVKVDPKVERGQKEEAQSCTPCHSLRIVHGQRLSKAAWARELDKMESWGTKFGDKPALLEYLVALYGEDAPPQPPAMTRDSVPRKGQ